ncbi:hypothetical protein D0Z07_7513 [Hyphodiscus hymeniophilus]|uniref:DNA ligase ATP-dependent N-terminal domain-containing protein n=1 Tax=Hyphodiscus hymeniophilus TaxID=353542 RepID=A0A9P7AUF5_9HELO|nr:hypothetical protein D0Z07_7513 [Hyphodiscus hymeniophilus]
MPFLYVYICDLLEQLGELHSPDCPTLIGLDKKTNDRTVKWFQRHQHRLNEFSVDASAVIRFFTPQKQTDRDYGLDGERLEQLIARVLGLPRHLHAELQLWRQGAVYGDLGACVKRVMDKLTWVATQAVTNKVTVEEIDQALLKIASHNAKSSPEVRSLASKVKNYDTIDLLGNIYQRLAGKEAKWFTRLILKSYGQIKFPERLDMSSNMQLLPTCVRVDATIDISDAFPILRDGQALSLQRSQPSRNTSKAAEFCDHRTPGASPVSRTRSPPTSQTCLPMVIHGTGTCRLTTQQQCPLINCLFILSPCISAIPYITENLLTWHGSRVVTSLRALSHPSLPRHCPRTGKRYRKIALVETNRSKPTEEFIIQISRLNLMRSRGRTKDERKKEWVEVYDWRILEAIAKIDQGQEKGYNPWRRNWVGAV